NGDYGYILRPEVIEGWFYLWRLTGKHVYKEWVWAAVQAIEKYCKKEAGFAGLVNVYNPKEVGSTLLCAGLVNVHNTGVVFYKDPFTCKVVFIIYRSKSLSSVQNSK
ncbi:Mannosyl-oligosaccharide 1,2-alpha-mannosidase C52E4.5, partial [Toxocara canis]